MISADGQDKKAIAGQLADQASRDDLRVSLHAHQEMVREEISYSTLREPLSSGRVIENYPDHRRGPCCLLCGQAASGRYVHVVCTTAHPLAIIITVYEPKPPKWINPFQRRK